MKKFILRICLFGLLVFIMDTAFGYIFKFLQSHSKGGETYRQEYIANTMRDSILIMGSSRAIHHYDPRVFVDSLGLSSYNCGLGGNGIIFNYGEYCLFKNRYVPKVILYDLYDQFDLIAGLPNERYINALRMYYDKEDIDSVFLAVDRTEKYKMLSKMRRYNGRFISVLSNFMRSKKNDILGYEPLKGQLNYELTKQDRMDNVIYDTLKLKYLRNLISETESKGTKLMFCISPIYGGGDESIYNPIKELAKKENIPFLSYYNDSSFIFRKEYFKDSKHLNSEGAEEYSKKIIKEIREIIE